MLRNQSIRFLWTALLAGAGICHSEHFLDVTKLVAPRNYEAPNGGSSGGGIIGDSGRPVIKASPLKVALLSLDKATYDLGEKFILEVRVENTGDKPVAFPWTVDSRISNPGKTKRSSLLVAVIIPKIEPDPAQKRTSGDDGWMLSAGLYGSIEEPGTFITLEPLETARIRFASTIWPKNYPQVGFPLEMPVKAEISFNEGPLSQNYWPAVSENSITIHVREKP